jgi:UDP-N-acetylglucosamine 2-epimerase (non-hydrolysing)
VLDHLSDINMVLTEHARRYLLAEGIRPETIIKTGSHMREVLDHYADAFEASDVLARQQLKPRQYVLVSAHREENVDSPEALHDLLDTLEAIVQTYGMPVLVSTHPRTRKRLDALGRALPETGVTFSKPFGFIDYIKLQKEAFCILSDSGTITEEASLLNLPAVTIRNAHERPEGMDVGTLIMSGLRREPVLDAMRAVTENFDPNVRHTLAVPDYENPFVSTQVLRVVLSYIDYVNRTVWHKEA